MESILFFFTKRLGIGCFFVAAGLIVIIYAPAATKKQPIPKRLVKKKRILSIAVYMLLVIIY
jgi:accessory gene regulator B